MSWKIFQGECPGPQNVKHPGLEDEAGLSFLWGCSVISETSCYAGKFLDSEWQCEWQCLCVFPAKWGRVIFAGENLNKENNSLGLLPLSADLWCLPAGPQLWQTIQTQGHFQLQLPLGKMCSADYAGLLQAFQVFILDELTARGFCQIQVRAWPSPQWGLGLNSGLPCQKTWGLTLTWGFEFNPHYFINVQTDTRKWEVVWPRLIT